jgi:hypothetical protein
VEATVIIRHALVAARLRAAASLYALIVVGLTHGLAAGDNDRARAERSGLLNLYFIAVLGVSGL